MTRSTGRRN